MDFIFYSITTWLTLLLVGLPIVAITLPKALRSESLVIAPLFGYGYITFISYYIFRSNIGGTDTYAWFVAIPPLLLLAGNVIGLFPHKVRLAELFSKDSVLALGCTAVAWLAISWLYFVLGSPVVALSISNLDVVELAVNSRYLQEFPRDTLIGFMGQTGHLQHTGDNIWFGPSLIVAFICTLFKTEPYKLQTIIMNIIAAQGGGVFFLFARQLPRMNRAISSTSAILYAVSPVVVYTAWQNFGAQTIAIPIILAILYLHTYIVKSIPEWNRSIPTLTSLVLLFSALLVTYHFMAVIVLALLGFHSIVLSILEKSWRRFYHQSLFLTVLFIVVTTINPLRIAAIFETYSMLNSNNGWFIPWINPIAQLGFNAGQVFLDGYSRMYNLVSYSLILILLTFVVWRLARRSEERPAYLAFFLGLFFPLFLAGIYLAINGQENGILGSYRSFKITATFCAVTILVAALPLTNKFFQNSMRRKVITLCGVGLLCVFSIGSLWQILSRHRHDIYLLPQSVRELSRIEAMDKVSGLNILDMGNFTNIWANYFLLKKPHIFQRFPYGGRVVGALNQPYTLIASQSQDNLALMIPGKNIFKIKTLNIGGRIPINDTFGLLEPGISGGYTLTAGAGWWDAEPTLQWTGREGRSSEVLLDVQAPVSIKLSGEYGQLRPGNTLELRLDDIPIQVTVSNTAFHSGVLTVLQGHHIIKIIEALDPEGPFPHDGRTLGILWRSFIAEQVKSP